LILTLLFNGLAIPSAAQDASVFPKKNIYFAGWIDLNKNGKKDVYEDPRVAINQRVEDLLAQMTVEEKTNQTATLYGYNRVLKDSLPTADWKNAIWKDGIANIDEQNNGWDGKNPDNIYALDIKKHVWAMNEVQRFFIEETRLGIPADFTNEGIRGVAFTKATSFPSQRGHVISVGCEASSASFCFILSSNSCSFRWKYSFSRARPRSSSSIGINDWVS
jgi:beta-glucosidase